MRPRSSDASRGKANDYRLIALVQYQESVLMIRFFGSHEDYDKVDAEIV
jgi:mRNA interferase HigB